MREITKFEPLPQGMAKTIEKAGWPIVDKVDEAAGCGIIDSTCRCVWTNKGNRIEVSMAYGTFICSQSKEIDPVYTKRSQAK